MVLTKADWNLKENAFSECPVLCNVHVNYPPKWPEDYSVTLKTTENILFTYNANSKFVFIQILLDIWVNNN